MMSGDSAVLRAADRHQPGHVPRHPEDPRGLGAGGHPRLPAPQPRAARARPAREPLPLPPAHAAAAGPHRLRLGRGTGVRIFLSQHK